MAERVKVFFLPGYLNGYILWSENLQVSRGVVLECYYRKVQSKRSWALNYLPLYPAHWALAQLTGPLLQVTLEIF